MEDARARLVAALDALRGRPAVPARPDRSALAVAVISGVVALASGWVAFELRHRLADARTQREGAYRPYLVVRNALAVRGTNWLGVTLENIGSGPALDITVEGRLIEEPAEWPLVPRWYADQMVRAAFANEEDRPHPTGDLHAIAAEQIGTVWFYGAWAAAEERAGILYFLGARITYHDLFGNRIDAGLDGEAWSSITYPEE